MKLNILLLILCLFIITTPLMGFEQVESIFTRGLNYYIQREFKKAALEWKKLLDREPNHGRAKQYMEKAFSKYNIMEINFYRGLNQFNQEQYRESIPYFQKTSKHRVLRNIFGIVNVCEHT